LIVPFVAPEREAEYLIPTGNATIAATFRVSRSEMLAPGDERYWQERQGQRSGYQFARVPGITRPLYSLGYDQVDTPVPGFADAPYGPDFRMTESRLVETGNSNDVLMALVRQHIALINDPAVDPVVILEMLTSIRQQLRSDGERFYEAVVDEYRQAAAINSHITCIQFVLGQLYQQSGSYDRAVDAYMLAMENNLFEVIARIHAAQCLIQEGLPGVAILQLQQALQSTQSSAALPIQARIWAARPREDGEMLQAPEAEIAQLLARASESKGRQEQMRTFLRRVKQTPSSYHEVVPAPRQFASQHDFGSELLESTQQESYDGETCDELADIYKIRGILHETIAKLCEQAVIYLRDNQREQAVAAIQGIGVLYEQLGDMQEAQTHMSRAAELASNDGSLQKSI
jgi:tetratricopeptide (TPR) repeat protein